MGTLNSRLQSAQTPTAGVVVSHLTTLRRRWIMGIFLRVWHSALLGYRGGEPNNSGKPSRAWLPDPPKR
jgi:hypothetical protein